MSVADGKVKTKSPIAVTPQLLVGAARGGPWFGLFGQRRTGRSKPRPYVVAEPSTVIWNAVVGANVRVRPRADTQVCPYDQKAEQVYRLRRPPPTSFHVSLSTFHTFVSERRMP